MAFVSSRHLPLPLTTNRYMRMRMFEGGVRVQVVEGEDTAVGGMKDSSLQG